MLEIFGRAYLIWCLQRWFKSMTFHQIAPQRLGIGDIQKCLAGLVRQINISQYKEGDETAHTLHAEEVRVVQKLQDLDLNLAGYLENLSPTPSCKDMDPPVDGYYCKSMSKLITTALGQN